MSFDFKAGDIIVYPYRWAAERDSGSAPDGSKERPCCLVLAVQNAEGATTIFLAAISSKPPRKDQVALEIPQTERQRAGVGKYPQAWVYVDELNTDLLKDSWYLAPLEPLGSFSRQYLGKVAAALKANITASRRDPGDSNSDR